MKTGSIFFSLSVLSTFVAALPAPKANAGIAKRFVVPYADYAEAEENTKRFVPTGDYIPDKRFVVVDYSEDASSKNKRFIPTGDYIPEKHSEHATTST
ncbi:856680bb-74db-4e02-b65e-281dd5f382c5 [Sclerotinia trifoliorum]|uniref:856680bb-74db-4e02-b65e-281dd5f382c5 n=1 Tax=Sclerotinia trifoliorum TaxID=28548 RepID=A0A8H2VUA1_9HELO|nr:856680bb-74db-4e02-b65e-281dd5f382c5 [Sclerotinia trifoliorum]